MNRIVLLSFHFSLLLRLLSSFSRTACTYSSPYGSYLAHIWPNVWNSSKSSESERASSNVENWSIITAMNRFTMIMFSSSCAAMKKRSRPRDFTRAVTIRSDQPSPVVSLKKRREREREKEREMKVTVRKYYEMRVTVSKMKRENDTQEKSKRTKVKVMYIADSNSLKWAKMRHGFSKAREWTKNNVFVIFSSCVFFSFLSFRFSFSYRKIVSIDRPKVWKLTCVFICPSGVGRAEKEKKRGKIKIYLWKERSEQ